MEKGKSIIDQFGDINLFELYDGQIP